MAGIDVFSTGHLVAFLALLKSCVVLLHAFFYVKCPSLTADPLVNFQEICFVTVGLSSLTFAHRLLELKSCL